MANEECYRELQNENFNSENRPNYFSAPDGYCLLGANGERMCKEDNGSPAITMDNNRAYLVGLG